MVIRESNLARRNPLRSRLAGRRGEGINDDYEYELIWDFSTPPESNPA